MSLLQRNRFTFYKKGKQILLKNSFESSGLRSGMDHVTGNSLEKKIIIKYFNKLSYCLFEKIFIAAFLLFTFKIIF